MVQHFQSIFKSSLESRKIISHQNLDTISAIDYSKIEPLLEAERAESMNYLKKIIFD